MPNLPSLTGLRAFEAAARLGSFTAAAQELHVTQAAVSRSVKALESQLGLSLFQRNANVLALTSEGSELLPDLTAAFGQLARSIARFEVRKRAPILTIGVGPTFALRWLIPRLSKFQRLHPQIHVHTATAGPTAALRPEWTCSVRLGADPTPHTVSEPLFSAQMLPVCSPGLAARLRRPADLARVTLLDVESTPTDWDQWLAEAGLKSRLTAHRLRYPLHAFALEAALDGQGVAMGLHPYVVDDLATGRLVEPFSLRVTRDVGWMLVYRAHATEQPGFQAFRRWVRREARLELPASRPA